MKLPFAPIETPRLVLRPPELGDWEAFDAFVQTERAHFIGGGPENYNPYTATRAFGHLVGHWVLRDFGTFVITLKDTGQPVGLAGPWYPIRHPEHELGWSIWQAELEGTGIAYEAALAAREHAYRTLGWTTAVSNIDADNTRSITLAERLGCWLDEDAAKPDDDHPPVLVYRHPAPDAEASA